MGEDVNNYEEIIFDDDDDDDYEDQEEEYEMEDQDNHCHHAINNGGDVVVEHHLECGASPRVVHCCENHHHACQREGNDLKNSSHHVTAENVNQIKIEKNGQKPLKCSDIVNYEAPETGRVKDNKTSRKPCIASSNSSSSDEFLELPFNDLSVSSGIYGAARNACYMNPNVPNIASNSDSNKRR